MNRRRISLLIFLPFLNLLLASPTFQHNVDSDNDNYTNHLWLSSPAKLNAKLEAESNGKLKSVLGRVGPNMRASSNYHDYDDVHLNESIIGWRNLHELTKLFAREQVQFYRPKIRQLLSEANVSMSCRGASDSLLASIENLDSAAVKMWSFTGSFPPVGLFDGQFTDLGSYRGCVNLLRTNQSAFHSTYCLLPFRPVVPRRRPFHRIFEREDEKLLNQFSERDVFHDFSSFAQYFHYVYLQTGACVPYECSAKDVQQVAVKIATNLYLTAGPVRCFTRAPEANRIPEKVIKVHEIENEPILVALDRPMNKEQVISFIVVGAFFITVLISTLWHSIDILTEPSKTNESNFESSFNKNFSPKQTVEKPVLNQVECSGPKHIAFNYMSMITNGADYLDTRMKVNEIKCLHGFRVATMIWIISVHSMQYNSWDGFTRIFENVVLLQQPTAHPIYNANYVVDNFFLMSGLLASYSIWHKGTSSNFSIPVSLVGRYLRLTPQVLLVSLLYILLPLAASGPFWYNMTHHAAKYCERNWWINLLHLQAFYREDEMCNLVGWWISVDVFYYILALGLMWMILNEQKGRALLSTCLMVGVCIMATAYKHYWGRYTPNNLGVVPQVAEVWSKYVVNFFWSPLPHAFPFFLGLWLGFALANNKWRYQVRSNSKLGWTVAVLALAGVNFSSFFWMAGVAELKSQLVSTTYNVSCTIIWALGFAWAITACHYGCAPTLNKVLSLKPLVLLSKASFIIYLSHMLVVRAYFGLQSSLIEVSMATIGYIVVGNIFLSIVLGVFLCIAFEGPCMKLQRLAIGAIKQKPRHSAIPAAETDKHDQKTFLSLGATGATLLK